MTVAKFLPPSTSASLTASDVIALLHKTGFEPIGAGFDAQAYAKDDRVIKVVCGNPGHRAAVEAFHDHPEVVGFPTIYGDVIDLSDGCFVYETERLHPSGVGPCDGCSYGGLEDALESDAPDDSNAVWLVENIGHDAMAILFDRCPDAIDWIDLHEDNRMEREDGQVVALDPFHLGSADDRDTRTLIRNAHRTVFLEQTLTLP